MSTKSVPKDNITKHIYLNKKNYIIKLNAKEQAQPIRKESMKKKTVLNSIIIK